MDFVTPHIILFRLGFGEDYRGFGGFVEVADWSAVFGSLTFRQ